MSEEAFKDHFAPITKSIQDIFNRQVEMVLVSILLIRLPLQAKSIFKLDATMVFDSESWLADFDGEVEALDTKQNKNIKTCYKILESLNSDISDQMDVMMEKYSMTLSECGIKSQHELTGMLQDFWNGLAQPLASKLKKSIILAAYHAERMYKLLKMVAKEVQFILQEKEVLLVCSFLSHSDSRLISSTTSKMLSNSETK